MSIFSRSRAKGLQSLPYLKYYYIWKWKSRLTLGLNATEITDYRRKASSKSYSELNFVQKSQWVHAFISPKSGDRGLQTLPCFEFYSLRKWESSRSTLGFNIAKITDYIKKGLE